MIALLRSYAALEHAGVLIWSYICYFGTGRQWLETAAEDERAIDKSMY